MKTHVLNRIIVMMLVICMVFTGVIPGTAYEAMAIDSAMNLQATVRVERIGETDIAPTTVEFTQGETAYDIPAGGVAFFNIITSISVSLLTYYFIRFLYYVKKNT